jgi:hypothetical protein
MAGRIALGIGVGTSPGKRSFLKKRTKKLLPLRRTPATQRTPTDQSLLLLFFRKEDLP